MTPEKKKRLNTRLMAVALVCVAIYLGIRNIDAVSGVLSWCVDIFRPLIVGFGIALILNVPMSFLERNLWKRTKKRFLIKSRRWVALILSLIFIIGLLAGVVMLILPTLVETLTVLVRSAMEVVDYINSVSDEEIAKFPLGQLLLDIDWNKLVDSLKSWLSNQAHVIADKVFGTLASLIGNVIDLFVSVTFAIYLLFSKQKLKDQLKRIIRAWIPEKKGEWLCHALSVANRNFKNFIAGQSIEAVILGILCFVGMLILRFPYAAMISTVVGITALIPVIGCYLGGGIGAFMILTEDPIQAIWFVVYIIVLQQIEGNLIYPRVMGDRVHLSPLLIIAAVTVGGGVGGAVGMLVGVPLAATAYLLFKEATLEREQKMQVSSADEDGAGDHAPPEQPPAEEDSADTTAKNEAEGVGKKKPLAFQKSSMFKKKSASKKENTKNKK